MAVDTHVLGQEEEGYFVPESTFDTAVKPAATDGFRHMGITIGQERARVPVPEKRATNSLMERVEGRRPVQPWSLRCIVRPSGTLGTPPDIGTLLKHAFGTETIVGGTSVTYSLLKDLTGLHGTLYRLMEDAGLLEGLTTCIVKTLTISWSSDDYLIFEFAGEGVSNIEAGYTLADGAGVAASSLVVDDADFFTQWGLIQIGSEDYSGAGIQINADPNHSTETLTLESTFTWSDNDIVRPHIPAATFIGNAKYGTNCTVSLDGGSTTVKVIRGSVVINTGLELMNQSSGHTGPDDITQQKLPEGRVDFNLELFVRRDETYLMSHAHRKVSKDLQIKLGTTATDRFTINMDTCEIDPAARDIGDSGPATWPLNGKALGSGSGENEIQLVQD